MNFSILTSWNFLRFVSGGGPAAPALSTTRRFIVRFSAWPALLRALQLPVLNWGRAWLKHRTIRNIEEPKQKYLWDTDYFNFVSEVLMSSFSIIGIVDRGPARPVGPPNLKSGGFARSRGRALRGTWITSTRTWVIRNTLEAVPCPTEPFRTVSTG